MRSSMLAGRQLLIVTGSGASWYFGAQLPAELVAHFAGLGQTIVAAQIMRFTNSFYFFLGMVTEAPSGDDFFMVEGHVLAGAVEVDSYDFFDDPSNLISKQIGTGSGVYQIKIGGGTTGQQSNLLIDYDTGQDDIRVGNLNNHLIVDNILDRALLETDDSVIINGGSTGTTIQGRPAMTGVRGSLTAGPSAAASFTSNVSFGITFPSTPNVHINLNSAAGPTGGWHGRATAISTTGFTLFGFGPASTFSVNWQWTAVVPSA